MKERGILFSAPMVRALLAGTKTQTRRVVKPPAPEGAEDAGVISSGTASNGLWWWLDSKEPEWASPIGDEFRCPYGVPGDQLWVRERCWIFGQWHEEGTTPTGRRRWRFKAIGQRVLFENPGHEQIAYLGRGPGWSYRNSIHMPRWASRLTLRITDVRVERLQDISEADALAEGVAEYPCEGPHRGPDATYWSADGTSPFGPIKRTSPVAAYEALWEEINGEGSWEANPFVWAVSFERVQP